jgi:hypothetical protein
MNRKKPQPCTTLRILVQIFFGVAIFVCIWPYLSDVGYSKYHDFLTHTQCIACKPNFKDNASNLFQESHVQYADDSEWIWVTIASLLALKMVTNCLLWMQGWTDGWMDERMQGLVNMLVSEWFYEWMSVWVNWYRGA